MDEVKAMTRAGESVGKAVGSGLKTARHGAAKAGRTGTEMSKKAAARAERELANHGITTEEMQELLAQKATGMSRKKLAKQTKKTRKLLAKNSKSARKELARMIDPEPTKTRRKWPWVLLVLAGIGIAVAVLSRRPEELPVAEAEFPTHEDAERSSNGDRPHTGAAPDPAPLGTDKEK